MQWFLSQPWTRNMHEQVMRHLGAQISLFSQQLPSSHTSKHSNQSFPLYNPPPALKQHKSFPNASALHRNPSNRVIWAERGDVGRAGWQNQACVPNNSPCPAFLLLLTLGSLCCPCFPLPQSSRNLSRRWNLACQSCAHRLSHSSPGTWGDKL